MSEQVSVRHNTNCLSNDCLFCCFTSTVNRSCRDGQSVMSYPNHTVPEQPYQRLFTSAKHTFSQLTTALPESAEEEDKNGRRNISMTKWS